MTTIMRTLLQDEALTREESWRRCVNGSAASSPRCARDAPIASSNRNCARTSSCCRREPPSDAASRRRRAARRGAEPGGVVQAMEALREQRGVPWLEDLARDLRYGCRMLARNPGFTAVSVVSLAIGIGANCAAFSFADTLLLRPLTVPRPSKLLTIGQLNPFEDSSTARTATSSTSAIAAGASTG